MGQSENNSRREVSSNTILPQETRKTSNRQVNFTSKTTGKKAQQQQKSQSQQNERSQKKNK